MVHFTEINQTPPPLLSVAGCWKRSNAKACNDKLPQILADNIDNGVRGAGLTIYVGYCRVTKVSQKIFSLINFCLPYGYSQ